MTPRHRRSKKDVQNDLSHLLAEMNPPTKGLGIGTSNLAKLNPLTNKTLMMAGMKRIDINNDTDASGIECK